MKYVVAIGAMFLLVFALYAQQSQAATPSIYQRLAGGGSRAPQPQARGVALRPPAGIECITGSTSYTDATGTIFVNCQAKHGRGQVVWRIRAGQSRLVLESGHGGVGNLSIDRDRRLYLTVTSLDGGVPYRQLVPGWVP